VPAESSADRARIALDVISDRRSYGKLLDPAPSEAELEAMLTAAVSAPDHKELRPWRFVVLEGAAKDAFGEVLEAAYCARCAAIGAEIVPAKADKERTKLGRAPLVVVTAVAYERNAKVPATEQFAAVAAATENLCLAATALGYGSMWRTGDPAYDRSVKQALGLRPDDAIMAFVYIGTVPEGRVLPARQSAVHPVVTRWHPPS
jgi:nitroreductase